MGAVMKVTLRWKVEGTMVIDAVNLDAAMSKADHMTIAQALEESGMDPSDHFVEAMEASDNLED